MLKQPRLQAGLFLVYIEFNMMRFTSTQLLFIASAITAVPSAVLAQVAPKQPSTPTTPAPNEAPPSIVPATTAAPPQTPDTPGAIWVAASPKNFDAANRPAEQPIDMVVIHDIEGSAESAVNWFQNPQARATSHYVVNSTTGQVWQMVKEHDIAWHAGNYAINKRSVGIEHEGYAYRPGFYNPVEYEASAKLVRSITSRYNIPRDRTHIIGHSEVPHPTKPGLFGGASGHTDPGPYWDWDSFMTLVRNDAQAGEHNFPTVIHPGELIEAAATFTNTGDDAWPSDKAGAADPALQARGPVYLGTWNPQGGSSPFFNYKFWTSPRLASEAVDGEVALGAKGRFAFTLLGPRQLGEVREDFRLIKVAPAPKVPVGFGDIISTTIRVEPWEIIQDTAQPGFTASGWTAGAGMVSRKVAAADEPAAPAQWTVPLRISGDWDVYARWPGGSAHSRQASYQVDAADGTHTVVVDQRKGGDWYKLGRYRFNDPTGVKVRLSAQGTRGTVVADAVRFVGPFPTP
ncbi:MAG: N-acetylmuramoyl-L-alanine amidase [Abitibacteriaceae bacterium]|nr:N-acetylmuramoyl-L-alanine amidase [Abditibacteriaceae bacterium]